MDSIHSPDSPNVAAPTDVLKTSSTVPPVELPPPGTNVPRVSVADNSPAAVNVTLSTSIDFHDTPVSIHDSFRFSARTCLELLPLLSKGQIKRELIKVHSTKLFY